MAKILIVSTNYSPEPTGVAVYITDLSESLNIAGHSVSVLTSLPHYPWWKTPEEYAHLTEGIYEQNGIKIIRVNHYIPEKMNAAIRIRFEISLWRNLRRVSKEFKSCNFDLCLSCIPTLAAGIVGKLNANKFGIPFGLIVQDLSGVGAKQSGLLGGAVISKIARAVESRTLHGANALVVLSPAMRNVVVGLGVEESRISQIHNYSARKIDSINKEQARDRFGWSTDDFVVLHTGNMGAKQNLENVVNAARYLNGNSRIKIFLFGHGNQESNLKALSKGRKNISVMAAVSDSDYSALLSAADLLLVNERKTQIEMSLPSKLTSYLFSERPVLAAVPRGGATWKFLEGVAELVEAGDPKSLASKIEELSMNKIRLKELARLGLEFAVNTLDPAVGRAKYLEWVEKLIHLSENR